MDVFGTGPFVDLFCVGSLIRVIGMARNKNIAAPNFAVIQFCFVFWNSQANQCAQDAAGSAASCGTTQCSHDRSGGNAILLKAHFNKMISAGSWGIELFSGTDQHDIS